MNDIYSFEVFFLLSYAMPKGAKSSSVNPPTNSKSISVPKALLQLSPTFRICNYLGPYAGSQPVLIWKLVRLGKVVLNKRASAQEQVKEQWVSRNAVFDVN